MNTTANPDAIVRPQIDVIVRTLLSTERKEGILRAVDSIHAAQARPIILVEGNHCDESLLDDLKNRKGVLLQYQPAECPGRGRAMAAGRRLVTAPYFMYLDDDDELLAAGMGQLAEHIASHHAWDVLITNGYFWSNGKREPMFLDLKSHAADPLRNLMAKTWMFPGANVFRTAAISDADLETDRDHHEWTYIAFRLAVAGKRIDFLDVATVDYNDTAISASKLFRHKEEEISLLEEMKADYRLDRVTSAIIERKYRNTLHTLAFRYWYLGERGKAWRCHLRSMRPPFTFKYLLSSRRLLLPSHKSVRWAGRGHRPEGHSR